MDKFKYLGSDVPSDWLLFFGSPKALFNTENALLVAFIKSLSAIILYNI